MFQHESEGPFAQSDKELLFFFYKSSTVEVAVKSFKTQDNLSQCSIRGMNENDQCVQSNSLDCYVLYFF